MPWLMDGTLDNGPITAPVLLMQLTVSLFLHLLLESTMAPLNFQEAVKASILTDSVLKWDFVSQSSALNKK